jgi:excinuclease UvrABC helicase subunit UvrB
MNFNDLFDDFFKDRKNFKNELNNEISNIINALQNFKSGMISDHLGDQMEEQLGPPDETEEFVADGLTFKKFVWNTQDGQLVKIIVLGTPSESAKTSTVTKTSLEQLQEKLEEALDTENYEVAIDLRDKIKNFKNEDSTKRKRNPKSK